VLGQIATVSIPTALSYILFPELPRPMLNKESLKQIYVFGKWIFFATLVSYFALQGDKFFVGRLFDADVLGMYSMATMITNIIIQEFGKGISSVLFPAYAKIKGDLKRLKEGFLKSYELLVELLVPASLGLYLVSDDLVIVILGDKWLQMIPILKLLAITAMVRGLSVSGSGLVLGLGRPKYSFIAEMVRALALLIFLLILPFKYGVQGVIVSLLLANSIAFPVHFAFWNHLLRFKVADIAKIYAVLAALLGVIFASACSVIAILNPGVIRLILSILAGLSSYCLVAFLIHKYIGVGPVRLLHSFYSRRKTNLKLVEQV
jgi:PST family polysaccharide transporter